MDSAINGKRGVPLVGPRTYDGAAATNPFYVNYEWPSTI